jgi:hypothetical protein
VSTADECDRPKSGHGGKRRGAGRKPKGYVAPTSLAEIDLRAALAEPAPDNVAPIAAQHAQLAITALVTQLVYGASEAAKIAAANELLDRGYGKPAVEIGGEAMLPFMAAPPSRALSSEIRTEAAKYARLAVQTLRRIAESGASESARVSASRSLLARGLGAAAVAKMPDEDGLRPLGKREEQAQAAAAAASGRFAPPPPPGAIRKDLQ